MTGGIKEAASPKEGGWYRVDLDGLRGLAILLVLVEHVVQSIVGPRVAFVAGPTGVTVFFVLSGYLITSLLQREERIDLRNFYLRRVVRLGPALIAVLAFVAVIGIVRGSDWIPGVAGSLTYSTNFFEAARSSPMIGHSWSLAIEEQFYVLWPLTRILAPRRLLLPIALGGGLIGAALYSGSNYYSTIANGGAILAGCALAISGLTVPRALGLVGLALIVVDVFFWTHALTVIGAVLVIAGPIRSLVPIAPIGKRAYGLYLWNTPLLVLLGPAGIAAAFVVAEASYRFVERPMLRRFRFPPRSGRTAKLDVLNRPEVVA